MALDYKNETGKDITVTSGYRSVQKQAELYAKDPTKAAKPGSSLHNFGYAIDVNSSDANKLSTLGLLDKWGFSRPLMGMGEPWHIEPQ
jgi:LAS superfamily LD-carboxypeptidase LdcB